MVQCFPPKGFRCEFKKGGGYSGLFCLVKINDANPLQCFDTLSWVNSRESVYKKAYPIYSQILFLRAVTLPGVLCKKRPLKHKLKVAVASAIWYYHLSQFFSIVNHESSSCQILLLVLVIISVSVFGENHHSCFNLLNVLLPYCMRLSLIRFSCTVTDEK